MLEEVVPAPCHRNETNHDAKDDEGEGDIGQWPARSVVDAESERDTEKGYRKAQREQAQRPWRAYEEAIKPLTHRHVLRVSNVPYHPRAARRPVGCMRMLYGLYEPQRARVRCVPMKKVIHGYERFVCTFRPNPPVAVEVNSPRVNKEVRECEPAHAALLANIVLSQDAIDGPHTEVPTVCLVVRHAVRSAVALDENVRYWVTNQAL